MFTDFKERAKEGVRREEEKSTRSIPSLTYPSYVSWVLFRHLFCPRQWNFYNYFTDFAYSSLEIWRPQRNSSKPAGHTIATETMRGWTFFLSVSHPDLSGLLSQSGYELVYLPCPSWLFIFPTLSLPGTESFTYLEKSQQSDNKCIPSMVQCSWTVLRAHFCSEPVS